MSPTRMPTHYTLDETAELYRVSGQTIKRWLRAGKVPAPVRVGRRMLFAADAVHEHLARLRAGTPAPVPDA